MGVGIMMLKMCLYSGPQVTVAEFIENLQTLVNIHIMKHEIRKSVNGNADAKAEHNRIRTHNSEVNQQNTRKSKENGKYVVPFYFPAIPDMMIFMKDPQEAVHYIFMCKPCHELHEKESGDNNQNINQQFHWENN
jgi:hypothetical protein